MPQDNTLGAPTEGLGQRVTFAFNTPQGVPHLDAGGAVGVRAGVQGGGTKGPGATRATGVQAPPNPTMDIIMRVAEPLVKQNMQKQRATAYVNGMQRAMQGEAVADIAESQPWYSNIFGDSDVVEGARAYTSHAKAQTALASMEDAMPELRKMAPKEAQAYFSKAVEGQMTGDAATDMTLMRSLTTAMPAVMRRQAKEHYGYLQETAAGAEAQAFQAGAVRLQAGASGLAKGYTTPEEFAGVVEGFVQSVVPAPGRDIKNYKDSMTQNLAGWAQNGNFHALNALKDRGFFDVLDADQRIKVDKAIEAGESKLRSRYSFEWNDDLAKVKAQADYPKEGQPVSDIAAQIDVLNKRYQEETGSRMGIISPDSRAAMLSGSAVAIAREKDSQATKAAATSAKLAAEGDKAAAANAKREIIRQRAMEGSLGTLSANKAYGKEDINEVAEPLYRAMSPEDQVKFLVNNTKENYVIDPIKMIRTGQIKAALSSENVDDFMPAFKEYVKLREANAMTADAYYGDMAPRLDGFYKDMQTGASPAGAFRQRFLGPVVRAKLSTEEMKAAVDVVSKDYNTFMPEALGGQRLRSNTARRVAADMADLIEQFQASTGDIKAATARAMVIRKQQGLEIVGGFAWNNSKGQTSLTDYLVHTVGPKQENPVPVDRINQHVDLAINELLYGEGGTAGIGADPDDDIVVNRLPDGPGNKPMFDVRAVGKDGTMRVGVLHADDVFTLSSKRAERKAKEALTTGTVTGPDPRAPSIYAGPEEWARYRKYQADKAALKK
jgi:hypothetical protein